MQYPNSLNRLFDVMVNCLLGISQNCINIGCGKDVRPLWVNCDLSPDNESVRKLDITNPEDLTWLANQNASIITCNHVIGYLTIGQAENFFKACFKALRVGGRLIIEVPDISKILNQLSNLEYNSPNLDYQYIEIVRAIYAYDFADALADTFDLKTYITGWTAPYLSHRLKSVGFERLTIGDPKSHDRRLNRDVRIEAQK